MSSLFKILKSKPLSVLKILDKENIDKKEVYKMLENPLNDSINLSQLIDKMISLDIKSVEKERIIKSLKTAINKF